MPLPFPEALQEFKVETSALPAQYGYHSAAAVNAVTKSGTNSVSGTLFEFVRDDAMNATDPFSPLGPDGKRRTDGLNRNQFGGCDRRPDPQGPPVLLRRLPAHPNPARSGIHVPVRADPGDDGRRFHGHHVGGVQHRRGDQAEKRVREQPDRTRAVFSCVAESGEPLPVPDNPCGQVFYDSIEDSDEGVLTTKVDYTINNNHSIFGRLLAFGLPRAG